MTSLTLLAQSPEDLPALAALLQDATLRMPDIAFDARGHRLVLLMNRYRWEAATPSRSRAAVRIETASRVQQQRWPRNVDAVLNLLTIDWADPHLTLSFSDGITLRARCEAVDLILEDLGDPWPTVRLPRHPV